ncbi:MAG: Rrf2 family transcriptional regulator [Bacteroidales bacterium]|nr:Rrf2 family transcriptional regulator [Bacteroidales bacterium]
MSKVVTISEAASIALHGMVLLAQSQDKLTNVNQIAELTSSSRHHVAKVFQVLVKEGWVNSHRGPTGGFKLIVDPSSINFLQIYELIEGEIDRSYCPFDKYEVCAFNDCLLGGITKKMTIEFAKYLESQTLAMHLNNKSVRAMHIKED